MHTFWTRVSLGMSGTSRREQSLRALVLGLELGPGPVLGLGLRLMVVLGLGLVFMVRGVVVVVRLMTQQTTARAASFSTVVPGMVTAS